jgi:hypothetical protein
MVRCGWALAVRNASGTGQEVDDAATVLLDVLAERFDLTNESWKAVKSARDEIRMVHCRVCRVAAVAFVVVFVAQLQRDSRPARPLKPVFGLLMCLSSQRRPTVGRPSVAAAASLPLWRVVPAPVATARTSWSLTLAAPTPVAAANSHSARSWCSAYSTWQAHS